MSIANEDKAKLSMKVMVNKAKTKVLFALVDNYLADILLSFLTFPLGVIPRILRKHYGDVKVGSLSTLSKGLENLDNSHFRMELSKLMLLFPRSPPIVNCKELKFNINDNQPVKYFVCEDPDCRQGSIIMSMYPGTERCFCGKSMRVELKDHYEDGDIVILKTNSFLISDDLIMLPNVEGSILQSIEDLGITDMDGAEQMTVTIGFNEIMDLFKCSLLSQTPLTDLILRKNKMPHSPKPKYEQFALVHWMKKYASSTSSKKFAVKAMIQKSTNKFLFIEAENDFVDFLFSFFVIPLGQVERLLSGNTCLGSIDNLYTSLANLNADKYLKTRVMKKRLLDPAISLNYLSKNQIFPISEENCELVEGGKQLAFWNPNEEESYVKGPGMFMVTDDLTVTPLCMFSALSILKELKIPYSDVEELEIDIGLEEGLRILKASLTSPSALTNGLIHILPKHTKRART